jgi:hypothetical protein
MSISTASTVLGHFIVLERAKDTAEADKIMNHGIATDENISFPKGSLGILIIIRAGSEI